MSGVLAFVVRAMLVGVIIGGLTASIAKVADSPTPTNDAIAAAALAFCLGVSLSMWLAAWLIGRSGK